MKTSLFALCLLAVGCGRMEDSSGTLGVDAAEPPDFERNAIALAIPDEGGPVAVFEMPLESTGLVGGLSFALKVNHTYVGDLLIQLEDPTGARIMLHNREGGSTRNIDKIYGSGGAAINLDAVMLHEVHGTWKLILDDTAQQDTGTLEAVKLTILKV